MKILMFSIETKGKYAYDSFHDTENMIITRELTTMIPSWNGTVI